MGGQGFFPSHADRGDLGVQLLGNVEVGLVQAAGQPVLVLRTPRFEFRRLRRSGHLEQLLGISGLVLSKPKAKINYKSSRTPFRRSQIL
jgi:hypothetical protein